MKHLRNILLVATLLTMAFTAAGQAKISTKKVRIADIGTRTTKVVIGGNALTDGVFRDEVSARWRISPFEFCTVEEYNSQKTDPDLYFLLMAKSEEKKYDGMLTLTLMKGGKPDAEDQRKRPVDVASLPLCSASFPSGREMTLLPAMLDILQDYATKAVESDKAGYSGFDIYARKVLKAGHKRIFFCEEDIVADMDEAFKRKHFDEDVLIATEAQTDSVFLNGTYNTLVSYTVAPFDPQDGAYCYKMLIDAQTHELYYFAHHRISARRWAGFLPKDMKIISTARK